MNVRSTEEWCDLAVEDVMMQAADIPLQTCDGWSCLRGHRARTGFVLPSCYSMGQVIQRLDGSLVLIKMRSTKAEVFVPSRLD